MPCGGVLTNFAGGIDYKQGIPVGVRETCVWTVAVVNSSAVELQLVSDGFNPSFVEINVYAAEGLDVIWKQTM